MKRGDLALRVNFATIDSYQNGNIIDRRAGRTLTTAEAEILAKVVACQLGCQIAVPLRRKRFTKPQFNLTRSARQANVADAFAVNPRELPKIIHRIVVLVDDIVTTGATLNACAKVLKQNGAREVWGLVLAKA